MEEVEKKRSLLNQAQTDQQQADLSAQELINKANLVLFTQSLFLLKIDIKSMIILTMIDVKRCGSKGKKNRTCFERC